MVAQKVVWKDEKLAASMVDYLVDLSVVWKADPRADEMGDQKVAMKAALMVGRWVARLVDPKVVRTVDALDGQSAVSMVVLTVDCLVA